MITYKFLEDESHLIESFYKKNGLTGPKKYIIAVGAFEDNELIELFTVGKPPKDNKKYTFVVNSCPYFNYLTGMLDFFHMVYDGKIEGLE